MNGFCLLFAIATVGTTAQTELGTNGQPVYTIRIESILVDELRSGKEIRTNVALKDRQFRRFRILVTPETAARNSGFQSRQDNTVRSESLVEYEPVLLENNEVEMWVQLAPERIETLATGRAIEGDVPADVPEIQRFRIFVGMNQLPRQQPATQTRDAAPPYLLTTDNGLAPAGANEPANRAAPAPFRGTPTIPSSSLGSRPTATSNTATRTNMPWRNGPDQTSVSPPPVDRLGSPPPATNYAQDNRYAAPNTRVDDQYSQPTYADRNSGYQYGSNVASPQSLYPQQGQFGAAQNYSQPQAMLAARPENPLLQPPLQSAPQSNWAQQNVAAPPLNTVANQALAAAQPQLHVAPATAPAPAPVTVAKAEEPAKRTNSTPLILTTLGLFTSLGVNAYLGWLAWSFFWRYRDAVNDSARARSFNAASRQAA